MQKRSKIARGQQRPSKRWRKLFSQDRGFNDKPFFETRPNPTDDAANLIVDSFFEEFESTIPSWELHVIQRFFKRTQPGADATQGQDQARAKLDDRDQHSLEKRQYPSWLTAEALFESLKVLVSELKPEQHSFLLTVTAV